MALPVDRLFQCAVTLLDTVVQHYEDQAVSLPARRYVSPGLPAWDCEQITAYVERTFSGRPDEENGGTIDCLVVRSAVIVVEIARCCPVADLSGDQIVLTRVADEEAAAQLVLEDSVLMVNAAVQGYRAGQLAGCKGLAVVEWEALGPEGGYAGGRQRFRWQLTEG